MNIEPDIFDYLETTSLEPHDDYTSEITYKDQKIIWNKLKEQDKEIERLKEEIKGYEQERERVLNIIEERNHKAIEYIENKINTTGLGGYTDLVDIKNILKGVDKE